MMAQPTKYIRYIYNRIVLELFEEIAQHTAKVMKTLINASPHAARETRWMLEDAADSGD